MMTGRGWGKTRTGAEWVRMKVETGESMSPAFVAPTAADLRDRMIEGESGILMISPPEFKPDYEPSKRRLTWPNGASATLYTAEEPDRIRGGNHDLAWCDELASWKFSQDQIGNNAWDMLRLALRIGKNPQTAITTTPKPIHVLRKLLKEKERLGVHVTKGDTYENKTNLSDDFLLEIEDVYGGTRLGRQEINGELLDDLPGAFWTREIIERNRVKQAPDLTRVVVAIDPAVTANEDSDETGIAVCGKGVDGFFYVLADRSCRLSPNGWAQRSVATFDEFKADRVIAEVNNGGDLVEANIRTVRRNISYEKVTASRGKAIRAEPIAALSEQNKIRFVGEFDLMEDQLCAMTPDGYGLSGSPDRAEAMIWGMTFLSDVPILKMIDRKKIGI